MNPIKTIAILVLIILALVAIRPGLTQKMADQQKEDVRAALIAHAGKIDPRPACAGAHGEELKNLAIQYGYCKK